MSRPLDEFAGQPLSKIIQKASLYAQNLQKYHELPHSPSKSLAVSQLAAYEKDYIQYVVSDAKQQLELFRSKERQDKQQRTLYQRKIQEGASKVEKNEQEILKKKEKVAEEYSKHLRNVYKRYEDEEKRHRQVEKEQAYKLRKELQEFYSKEEQRKREAEHRQVHVGTEYQKAVERINKIHQQNEIYSHQAESALDKQLKKNSHHHELLTLKRRNLSAINQEKQKIMNQSLSLFRERENRHIQNYGQNEASSLSAWQHIAGDCQKTKQRLAEFFKKRSQKWASEKKRLDAQDAETPQKCLSILDKTSRSAFRRTVSTFRNSSMGWEQTVRKNQSQMKEMDQVKKDHIMDEHLDLRLTNRSSFKVRERMNSMRQQASKVAQAYL